MSGQLLYVENLSEKRITPAGFNTGKDLREIAYVIIYFSSGICRQLSRQPCAG